MVLSGRGGFRSDTRTMRLERLHGPKDLFLGHGALSRRKGKAPTGGSGENASGIGESSR